MLTQQQGIRLVIGDLLRIDSNWGKCEDIVMMPLKVPAACIERLEAFVEHEQKDCPTCLDKATCSGLENFIPDIFNNLMLKGLLLLSLEEVVPSATEALIASAKNNTKEAPREKEKTTHGSS